MHSGTLIWLHPTLWHHDFVSLLWSDEKNLNLNLYLNPAVKRLCFPRCSGSESNLFTPLCFYSSPLSLSASSSLLPSLLCPEFNSEDKRLQSAETPRPRRLNKEPVEEEEDASNCQRDVLLRFSSDVFSLWTGNWFRLSIRGHMEDKVQRVLSHEPLDWTDS